MGCNPQDKSSETNKPAAEFTQKIITFANFKKIKGVDNVQDVPFQLFTKLDSVRFFVAPDKDSSHLKIAYNKLDNYYDLRSSMTSTLFITALAIIFRTALRLLS